MATKLYDYDAVINYCTSSLLTMSVENAQESLTNLRSDIKTTEETYHGKGYQSSIFEQYERMYDKIGQSGSRNYGAWDAIKYTIDKIEEIKRHAIEDKRKYEEELRREQEAAARASRSRYYRF